MSKKRRISPRVPSYRKHKGSGQAVVTILGEDHYLGKYGTKESRNRYHTLIGEYLRLKGQGVPPELRPTPSVAKNITVIEAVDRYLTWSKGHHAKPEQAHVRSMLRILMKLYENEKAANIGPAELRE